MGEDQDELSGNNFRWIIGGLIAALFTIFLIIATNLANRIDNAEKEFRSKDESIISTIVNDRLSREAQLNVLNLSIADIKADVKIINQEILRLSNIITRIYGWDDDPVKKKEKYPIR